MEMGDVLVPLEPYKMQMWLSASQLLTITKQREMVVFFYFKAQALCRC